MKIQQFLLAIRARFGLFVTVLLITVLTTVVVSMLLPKSYIATTSMLVDSKDEQSMSGTYTSPRQQIGYLQTQVDIVTSQKVAQKVVAELKLAENPLARAAFESDVGGAGSIESWLAENLLKRLKVDTSQSSVIQLMFTAQDPKYAEAVVNGFAKAYMDTVLDLRVAPSRQTAAWFDEQLKGLRQNLDQAQAKQAAFQKEHGIVNADDRFDVENSRLAELSTQLTLAQNQTYDASGRQQLAREFIDKGASPENVPDVAASAFIQGLKNQVLAGEAKLQELSTQYGSNHPQYERQVSENRNLREKLDREMKQVVAGMENSARQARKREADIRAALEAQRRRVLGLRGNRTELQSYARDVESAQRAYDIATQRLMASKVESRASQTNVVVLSPATAPRTPARPKLALNAALSVVVGIILGLCMVFLREMTDRRVRSLDDVSGGLQVPLLGMLNARLPTPAQKRLPHLPGSAKALPNPS